MSNVTLPRAVADHGERTTFLGIGSVDVTVDFANVDMGRVTMSPDRRAVTIALPAP
ncbi:MAG: DUF4230 domain-containing protein [Pseudonocardiaceae bacterium]